LIPSTTIEYKLKSRSRVRLDIYNSRGELVKTVINKELEGGYYSITVNAEDLVAPGSKTGGVASGVYIYRINVIDSEKNIPVYINSRKMVLLKENLRTSEFLNFGDTEVPGFRSSKRVSLFVLNTNTIIFDYRIGIIKE